MYNHYCSSRYMEYIDIWIHVPQNPFNNLWTFICTNSKFEIVMCSGNCKPRSGHLLKMV